MKTQRTVRMIVAALATALLACAGAQANTKTWTGNGDWFVDTGNWSGGLPESGEHVVVTSGSLRLTNSTPPLASFTLNGGTVTMTNWTTRLEAVEVTLNGGTLTHGGNMGVTAVGGQWIPVARIHVVCSNFTMNAGTVNANALGYKGARFGDGGERTGRGPGGSSGATGASYGGKGAQVQWGTAGAIYGANSPEAPDQPGSGAGAHSNNANDQGGHGGGSIRIDASGHVAILGTITANGGPGVSRPAGGSGGAVLIYCRTLSGSGTVSAQGGQPPSGAYANAGGGGRIAVHYDPGAQAALALPTVTFTTLSLSGENTGWDGDMGTLWFTDNRFLESSTLRMTGQWVGPGPTTLAFDSLSIPANRQIRFAASGTKLTVTNNMQISGSRARLCMGGDVYIANQALNIYSTAATGPTLEIGGSLSITNGGVLNVRAGQSHALGTGWGAAVDVGGNLHVASGSTCAPRAQPVNGAAVRIRTGSLTVAAGASITTAGLGYRGGIHSTVFAGGAAAGLGSGAGAGGEPGGGGGYGGRGGGTSAAYGRIDVPFQPGSGGGTMLNDANDRGGFGGGLVWLEVAGVATVNGTITATAGGAAGRSSGGSGGGLMLHADTLNAGSATLAASGSGASDSRVCGGGGGRIALQYRTGAVPASVALDNPAGSGTRPGHKGTWFTAVLPAKGSLLTTADGTPAMTTVTAPLTSATGIRLARTVARWDDRQMLWSDRCTDLAGAALQADVTYTLSGLEPAVKYTASADGVPLNGGNLLTADELGRLTVVTTVADTDAYEVRIARVPGGTVILAR